MPSRSPLDDPAARGSPRHPLRRVRGRRGRLRVRRLTTATVTPERITLRQPDFSRRVVVTGLGVISPVGNDKDTAWSNLVNGNSGLTEITKFDTSGVLPPVGRRGPGLRRRRVDGRQGGPAQRADDVVRRRGRQAGHRRRRPRDHRRQPRGHRRRVRLRRRRPDADDRELATCSSEKGPNRVAPTFIANGLVDSTSGMIAIETGRHRPQHLRRDGVLHGDQLRRRGRRDHPPRRRPHGHRRLGRDAAARGGPRGLRQHARPGLAPRRASR